MMNIAKNHDVPVRFNGSIRWWQGLKPAIKRNRQTITYHQIGNTLFTVVAECAPDATETISGKLERLMMRRYNRRKELSRLSRHHACFTWELEQIWDWISAKREQKERGYGSHDERGANEKRQNYSPVLPVEQGGF